MTDDRILAPGTVAYLVHVTSHQGVNGRVVTVAEAPVVVDDEPLEGSPWHLCEAHWIPEVFPGLEAKLRTPRRCLLPIAPPGRPLDVPTRDAEPVE